MTEENKPRPYITQRTKMWRSRELKPFFLDSIDTIEEYGCRIIYVATANPDDAWSYTTGVHDTCGKQEIIAIGLRMETATAALNEAVRRLWSGVDLTQGRHSNIIGTVDVEFRVVNPRWLHHLMLHTNWYYEGKDVPVLQLIFPDLQTGFQASQTSTSDLLNRFCPAKSGPSRWNMSSGRPKARQPVTRRC